MRIDRKDAHDRFEHFTRQGFNISECCQNMLDQRPFGDIPFYCYVHSRTDEDGVTTRLIWQPRLTKPKASPNTMLFKLYPPDIVKVLWMLPKRELWEQFEKGKMMQNKTVIDSIQAYRSDRKALEAREPDDLSDEQINKVYEAVRMDAQIKRKI